MLLYRKDITPSFASDAEVNTVSNAMSYKKQVDSWKNSKMQM